MEERGTEGMAKMPGWARALTLGNGGGGVGGIRQLVGGQRGHASGRKAPGQKVVECCQLVGSCLLTPTRTAVAEPDLCVGWEGWGVEKGVLSLAPGGELRLSWNKHPSHSGHFSPHPHHHPPSRQHPPPGGHPHLPVRGQFAESCHRHGPFLSSRPPSRAYDHCPHFTDEQTETQSQ